MALFIRQNDERSELQQRLAAELQERAKTKANIGDKPPRDGVEDSEYLRDTKTTTSLAWVWIIIVIVICFIVVGTIIYI